MKKILTLFLCLCICLSVFCMPVAAANNDDSYIIRATYGSGGYIKQSGRRTVEEGGSIQFTIVAYHGYKIKDVFVDGRSVGARDYYTFSNVNENHFIRAVFEQRVDFLIRDNTSPYLGACSDVKPNHWFYEDVAKAFDYSLFYCVEGNSFRPYANITRGEIAKVMHAISMNPVSRRENSYSDIPMDSRNYEAADYCVTFGYMKTDENGNFNWDAPITRENLAFVLWKYSGSPDLMMYKMNSNDVFTDVDDIDASHLNALTWCVENMIYLGRNDFKLSPKDNVTRAEASAILVRFMENVYYR